MDGGGMVTVGASTGGWWEYGYGWSFCLFTIMVWQALVSGCSAYSGCNMHIPLRIANIRARSLPYTRIS